jgi:two-component system, OmpR family, KDP operon response regulator KdpE
MVVMSAADMSRLVEHRPTRVLLVLDQPVLAELISLTLSHGACSVRTATSVEHVATIVAEWQPRLVVLDMALSGTGIIQQLRNRAVEDSPALLMGLVGSGDLQSKLAVFNAGADDMLTVPFAPEELLARVLALTRRSRTDPLALLPTIGVGEIEIDIVNRTVRTGGLQLRLTPVEFVLLYLFMANLGRVLTRREILRTLWGTDHEAESNIVDQHVRNLRARLHTGGQHARSITTVAGRGYRFCVRTQAESSSSPGFGVSRRSDGASAAAKTHGT